MMRPKSQIIIITCLLVLVPLAVFYQIGDHDFINMDDPFFIQQHKVQEGLTRENLINAFTLHDCLWMPLTWLSHMIDSQIYKTTPRGHHFTSLALHIANGILIFLLLVKITGRIGPGALVGALLVLHPINVETVAYISARKGILCAFFWLLALHAYCAYSRRRTIKRYFPILLLFLLGAMAKPAIVIFPFMLLIMDYWPLQNFGYIRTSNLLREKIPFFLLAAVFSVVAVITQHQAGTTLSLATAPFLLRVENMLVSYALYLWKVIYPLKLAIFYPFPQNLAAWKSLTAGGILILISMAAIASRRRRPWFLAGWLWFLVAMLPTIGLIKTGQQAMADRYAYIPLIGIFIIASWEIFSRPINDAKKQGCRWAAVIGILILLAFLSWRQAGYWKNSRSVFEHAVRVTSGNYLAYNNLGEALVQEGKTAEAYQNFRQALSIAPNLAQANYNLGLILRQRNQPEKAIPHFSRAVQSAPDFVNAHFYLAQTCLEQGYLAQADKHFQIVLRRNSQPAYKVESHNARGIILARQQNLAEAAGHFREALKIEPQRGEIHNSLGQVLVLQGQEEEAIPHFQQAASLVPGQLEPINHLVRIYKGTGEYQKALVLYRNLLLERPDCSVTICYNIAAMYSLLGKRDQALEWLRESIAHGFSQFKALQEDQDFQNLRDSEEYKRLLPTRFR